MFDFRNSDLVLEAKKSKFDPKPAVLLLIVLALFYASSYISAIPLSIFLGIKMALSMTAGGDLPIDEAGNLDIDKYQAMLTEYLTSTESILASLFVTVTTILLCIIWCRLVEKRSFYSMGFSKKGAFKSYLVGLIIGLIMMSLVYLICASTGAIRFVGVNSDVRVGLILLFFLGFMIQGASEEIFLRGLFMISASRRLPIGGAIAISSIFFSLMHTSNTGFGVMPVLNLVLFGVFASLYMLRFNNVWGVCAIHSMWNFAQGNLFGCSVSGLNVGESVLISEIDELRLITNGGAFGPEGGIAVTLVLLVSIMFVVFLPSNKNDKKEENFETKE
jgi:membrane protease YdiL (CAAX protease family)